MNNTIPNTNNNNNSNNLEVELQRAQESLSAAWAALNKVKESAENECENSDTDLLEADLIRVRVDKITDVLITEVVDEIEALIKKVTVQPTKQPQKKKW